MLLAELQQKIGEWSKENFGEQTSKATGQCLGSIAPLLGIVEELGELAAVTAICSYSELHQKGNEAALAEVKDAVADIGVYLCDFCSREGIDLFKLVFDTDDLQPPFVGGFTMLVSSIGELCRCVLKRHQGIRGFSETAHYEDQRNRVVVSTFCMLEDFIMQECDLEESVKDLIENVWNKIVSKRNWKSNPNSTTE